MKTKRITIPEADLKKFKIALFDYHPYLNRMGEPCKPFKAPFRIGDVVVVRQYCYDIDDPKLSPIDGVGVVVGSICEDGELRTDLAGMVSFDYLELYDPKKHKKLKLDSGLKKCLKANNLL